MYTVEALKLFNSDGLIDDLSIDAVDEIFLDFSDVSSIELKDIKTLLNLQKVAILNKKRIKIENVKPEVLQILEVTGLYKTFTNIMTNPIFVSKRLSFPIWK